MPNLDIPSHPPLQKGTKPNSKSIEKNYLSIPEVSRGRNSLQGVCNTYITTGTKRTLRLSSLPALLKVCIESLRSFSGKLLQSLAAQLYQSSNSSSWCLYLHTFSVLPDPESPFPDSLSPLSVELYSPLFLKKIFWHGPLFKTFIESI